MSSINTPFDVDAGLGRVRTQADRSRYIRQLMTQVLRTAPGERVNRPTFGCGVRQMVFGANHPAAAALAEVAVFQALRTWMADLIEVREIKVTSAPGIGRLDIEIAYREIETGRHDLINVEVV